MAQGKSRTQGLNGLPSLAYVGVMPSTPINFFIKQGAPTTNDYRNCYVGDQWLDNSSMYAVPSTPPTSENLWILVSVANKTAIWINMGIAGIATLTGNSGGPVFPLAGNINVVGDGVTVNAVGNPATNTITFSAVNTGTVTGFFTDDTHTVTPTAGIVQLHGTHGLNTTGTIGPNTATFAINNAITLGDLATIGTGADAVTASTGDITSSVGNFNLQNSNSTGSRGYITFTTLGGGSQISVLGFPGNNVVLGGNASAPALVYGTAVANILIGGGYTSITTGRDNSVVGAGIAIALTTGSNNCIFGGAHTAVNLTSGNNNTIIGTNAGTTIATGLIGGSGNVLIGQNAGSNFTGNESNNTIISGPGVAGDNQIMRLGGFGAYTQLMTFVDGIRGITTTNNNAIAVLVDSAGQLGTISSSRTFKENIVDMGSYSDSIRSLRPVVFNYKEHAPEDKSVGLVAEEVETIAPHLVAYNQEGKPHSVKYHDLVPMLLNEFQKHCHLIGELQAINADLLNRIRLLEEHNLIRGV